MAPSGELPQTFLAWQVKADASQGHHLSANVTDNLELVEVPMPELLPGHVIIRIHAAALNFRDLLCISHSPHYPSPLYAGYSPCSDGAGIVAAVAEGGRWTVGDRALLQPNAWIHGNDPYDFDIDKSFGCRDNQGTLREYIMLPDDWLIAVPSELSLEEAASLSTAGVTALHAFLFGPSEGGRIRQGQTVLTQGTGGVSSFAIQLASALGATVIALSSTEEKLQSAKALGATHTINYKTHSDWSKEVLNLTNGRGVDHVLDVGGSSTIKQSIASLRQGGSVAACGVLNEGDEAGLTPAIIYGAKKVQGILGSSKLMREETMKLVQEHGIHPVIANVWNFRDAPTARRMLMSQGEVGKIMIRVGA